MPPNSANEFIDGDPFDPNQVVTKDADVTRINDDINNAVVGTLRRRKEAYSRVFKGGSTPDDVKIVLDDLSKFCRGETTIYDDNDRMHCLLTGRNEVYRRIKDHVDFDFDTLATKYIGE